MLPRAPSSTLFPYTTLFRSSDMDLAAKGLGAKEWNNSLKTKLSLLPKKLFRIRMSRNLVSSDSLVLDRKSGSAGMPRPISYAVFCLKKKKKKNRTTKKYKYR